MCEFMFQLCSFLLVWVSLLQSHPVSVTVDLEIPLVTFIIFKVFLTLFYIFIYIYY